MRISPPKLGEFVVGLVLLSQVFWITNLLFTKGFCYNYNREWLMES